MGSVTDYLVNLIARQVEESWLVVWYDPDKHYQTFTQNLLLPGTTIVRYAESFFALRHAVEPLLNNL